MSEHEAQEPDGPVAGGQLERDLRRLASAAVAASEAATLATPATLPTPTSDRGPRLLAIAASFLAVLALGAAALALSTRNDDPNELFTTPGVSGSSSTTNATAARVPPPPFEDLGPVTTWLNARRIPTSGADLVLVLRNNGTEAFGYGVYVEIEQWDGHSWTVVRKASTCLDFWHCVGTLHPTSEDVMVPAIGLTAPPGGIGSIQILRVEGLPAGWYRIGPGGEFEIVDGAAAPAPIGDVAQHRLQVAPALLPTTGGKLTITLSAASDGGTQTSEGVEALEARLQSGAVLQRWDGSDWISEGVRLTLRSPEPGEVLGNVRERYADVGPLEPGAYRVVRTFDDGAEAIGVFWVLDPADP